MLEKNENVKKNEKKGKGPLISRRGFVGSLAAAGVGISTLSSVARTAKAGPYGAFDIGDLTDARLLEMLKQMLRIRWYDRTVGDSQLSVRGFRGYGHLSCGQEAVAVGVCNALNNSGSYPDWLQGTHRSHAQALAKGVNLREMAAEITYKASGTNKGFGGSMHIMTATVGMMGSDGIVGGGGIIAAGAAYGLKARGQGQVSVRMGGDGDMNAPWNFNSYMQTSKFNLPYIHVIECNGYQASNSIQVCNPQLKQNYTSVAKSAGVPAVIVDGQSVLDVYSVMKTAVARARAGDGPTFIQANTYRYYGHFGAGGAKPGEMGAFGLSYRPDREVKHWIGRDPINIHKATLIEFGILTEADYQGIERTIKQEVADAFAWADGQPVPRAEDGITNVFRKGPKVLPRQLASCPLWSTESIV